MAAIIIRMTVLTSIITKLMFRPMKAERAAAMAHNSLIRLWATNKSTMREM